MKSGVRDLNIDRISPDLRAIFWADAIEDLAWDIRLQGQREPIQVRFARESFRIVDGEKRWRACKRLGMSSIQAAITEVEPFGF